MIHALLVARHGGRAEFLLERFYGEARERETFFADLYDAVKGQWNDVGSSGVHRVVEVGHVTAVHTQLAGLVFVVAGRGEYDELVLSEVLQALVELVALQCTKGLSENEFLAQHERVVLLVDHMIRHGTLEHTDKDVLAALVNQNAAPDKAALERVELSTVSVLGYSGPSLVRTPVKQKGGGNSAPVLQASPSSAAMGAPGSSLRHEERMRADSQVLINAGGAGGSSGASSSGGGGGGSGARTDPTTRKL